MRRRRPRGYAIDFAAAREERILGWRQPTPSSGCQSPRGRLRTGLVPDEGFAIGFVDGLTATVPVLHTVIHVVPRQVGEQVALPECTEWISDDGLLA